MIYKLSSAITHIAVFNSGISSSSPSSFLSCSFKSKSLLFNKNARNNGISKAERMEMLRIANDKMFM